MNRVVQMLDREPGQKAKVTVAGFAIEEGIPLPTGRGTKNPLRQAMEALEVGQSIVAPETHGSTVHGVAKLLRPKKFQTAGRVVGGVKAVRVWRIS